MHDFEAWAAAQRAQIEAALDAWVPADAPAGLGEAMRYAVLDGGKRVRPLLVLATAEALDGHAEAALRAACAVELIHAYSLVHDDMPCMDNDLLRRGKPTVHAHFGEAQALLAGDALQALAFALLTPREDEVPAAMQAALCRDLAQAAGASGMAGGQAIDLASIGKPLTERELRAMHRLKTGALLQGCVRMGMACAARAPAPQVRQALNAYGDAVGLAFQVVDDVLDVTADAGTLGKTAGKDAAAEKPTYVSVLGLPASQALAHELGAQALRAVEDSGLPRAQHLRDLVDRMVNRTH